MNPSYLLLNQTFAIFVGTSTGHQKSLGQFRDVLNRFFSIRTGSMIARQSVEVLRSAFAGSRKSASLQASANEWMTYYNDFR